MRKIKIRRFGKDKTSKFALVDDEDYKELSDIKWTLRSNGYPAHRIWEKPNKEQTIYMHNIIMNCPPNLRVDHINHNPLDNRKVNLRICTHQENMFNKIKYKNGKSHYIGVYWNNINKKWFAQIRLNGKLWSASFDNERHAAMARDIWAKDLFGEFAKLNFSA